MRLPAIQLSTVRGETPNRTANLRFVSSSPPDTLGSAFLGLLAICCTLSLTEVLSLQPATPHVAALRSPLTILLLFKLILLI